MPLTSSTRLGSCTSSPSTDASTPCPSRRPCSCRTGTHGQPTWIQPSKLCQDQLWTPKRNARLLLDHRGTRNNNTTLRVFFETLLEIINQTYRAYNNNNTIHEASLHSSCHHDVSALQLQHAELRRLRIHRAQVQDHRAGAAGGQHADDDPVLDPGGERTLVVARQQEGRQALGGAGR